MQTIEIEKESVTDSLPIWIRQMISDRMDRCIEVEESLIGSIEEKKCQSEINLQQI